MYIGDFTYINGDAKKLAQIEVDNCLTFVHMILPIKKEDFVPGKYSVEYKNKKIEVILSVVKDIESDPIIQGQRDVSFGTRIQGLTELSIEYFTDNRAKYPALLATIIFPYKLASWASATSKFGTNIQERDIDRIRVTKVHQSEEKIATLIVLNKLFESKKYGKNIDDITYDDVTAFLETYFHKNQNGPILKKYNFLTTKSAYEDSLSDYYLSTIDKESLQLSAGQAKKLFENKEIRTENDLLDVVYTVLTDIQRHIEHRGWIHAFWDSNYSNKKPVSKKKKKEVRPKKEPDIQPTLLTLFHILLSPLGIHISRESDVGVGKLDFCFSHTTKNNQPICMAMEFKLAHHKKIKHGMEIQLPAYMKALKTGVGIYAVLWFKDKKSLYFSEPKDRDIEEMKEFLSELSQGISDKKILSLVIDASIKQTASKAQ